MSILDSRNMIVTLQQKYDDAHMVVTVGISVNPKSTTIRTVYSKDYRENPSDISMGRDCETLYQSLEDLRTACELGIGSAIYNFQRLYSQPLDCTINIVGGQNLSADCTIGFFVATVLILTRATGFSSGLETELYGWSEVKK